MYLWPKRRKTRRLGPFSSPAPSTLFLRYVIVRLQPIKKIGPVFVFVRHISNVRPIYEWINSSVSRKKWKKNKKKHTHWSNDGEKLSFGPSLTIFPPYYECKREKTETYKKTYILSKQWFHHCCLDPFSWAVPIFRHSTYVRPTFLNELFS